MEGTVLALWRWPVLGMGGERMASVRVDVRGVGGDLVHSVVADGRALTEADAPELGSWTAAYPFTAGATLDPASPPYAVVTSPRGHSYRWGDPRLRTALEDALGRVVELRRDLGARPDYVLVAGAGAPAELRANLRVDLDLTGHSALGFAGGVRMQLLEEPRDGAARARPVVVGRIAEGHIVSVLPS